MAQEEIQHAEEQIAIQRKTTQAEMFSLYGLMDAVWRVETCWMKWAEGVLHGSLGQGKYDHHTCADNRECFVMDKHVSKYTLDHSQQPPESKRSIDSIRLRLKHRKAMHKKCIDELDSWRRTQLETVAAEVNKRLEVEKLAHQLDGELTLALAWQERARDAQKHGIGGELWGRIASPTIGKLLARVSGDTQR